MSFSLIAGCDGTLLDNDPDPTPDASLSTPPDDVDGDILYILVEEEVESGSISERSSQAKQIRYVWVALAWDEYEQLPVDKRALCTNDPWADEIISITGDAIPLPNLGEDDVYYWSPDLGVASVIITVVVIPILIVIPVIAVRSRCGRLLARAARKLRR